MKRKRWWGPVIDLSIGIGIGAAIGLVVLGVVIALGMYGGLTK